MAQVLVAALIGAVVVLAVLGLVVLRVRVRYAATFLSQTRYTLPHQPFEYTSEAQRIRLVARDGVRLEGVYLARLHPDAGIVIYPSFVAGAHGFAVVTMAQWLARGFDVLVVEPRGVGRSSGIQGPRGDAELDVLAGATFLRDRGDKRVGVLAEGDSTVPAIVAASDHPGAFDALAVAGPVEFWGQGQPGESYFTSPLSPWGRLYWRLAAGIRLGVGPAVPVADRISRVAPVPVLIVGSQGDPGHVASQLYEAASEPRSLRLLPGSGLPCRWPAFAAYYQTVRQWFELSLEPAAAPASAPLVDGSVPLASSSASASGSTPSRPPGSEGVNVLPQLLAEPRPIAPTLPTVPPAS